MSRLIHAERHYTHRIGWLRAAVLGANDGIVSTAALVVGVAAADSSRSAILVAGAAGLVAGAMSMAAGEYVSVSSQADTDGPTWPARLASSPSHPKRSSVSFRTSISLAASYADLAVTSCRAAQRRGSAGCSRARRAGITEAQAAKPIQAALASAATFSVGAALPLVIAALAPPRLIIALVTIASLISLAGLGALAAGAGGAGRWRGAIRVTFWSALAMALTALVGRLFGATA